MCEQDMSKKSKKTIRSENALPIEILKGLLVSPQPSMYKLKKEIKGSSFSTVRRNLYKLKEAGLVKIGTPEERNAMGIELTPKGIATLLIDVDLKKEELVIIEKKTLQKMLSRLSPQAFSEIEPFMTETFSEALLAMKPKVNLKFFDEKYFLELYRDETWKAITKAIQKFQAEYEKKGIWATEEQRQKDADEFFSDVFFENLDVVEGEEE